MYKQTLYFYLYSHPVNSGIKVFMVQTSSEKVKSAIVNRVDKMFSEINVFWIFVCICNFMSSLKSLTPDF